MRGYGKHGLIGVKTQLHSIVISQVLINPLISYLQAEAVMI